MSVQKAVLINETGPATVLKLVHDFSVPARQPGQVLVRVISASVNPVDYKVRSGAYAPTTFPMVLGGDISGIVVEADAESKFKAGDKVFALTDTFYNNKAYGTYLEYFPANESWLALVPENLPVEHAAGVPLAALTAWQALDPSSLAPGQRVLVIGAAGGVGHFGVQIAKAFGAHVVGTAGPTNQHFLKEIGVDEAFNYRESTIDDAAAKGEFDVVLDLIGGEEAKAAYKHLKPDGKFAHVFNTGTDPTWLGEIAAAQAEGKGPRVTQTLVAPSGEQLSEIAALIAAGKVKLEVQAVFPLEEAVQAHQLLEKGTGIRGKVVLKVQEA